MKRLVLFSDGTGNSSAKAQKTNVWRMFEALDQTNFDQLAKYDDGVGTSSNKYLAALGGAFGFGLKRNVIDLYKFVCRNYEPGDLIYGFGFSRGAFTIRVVAALIATEGLVRARSESELQTAALAAYREYRAKRFKSYSPLVWLGRALRDFVIMPWSWLARLRHRRRRALEQPEDVPIEFLGLWDTVGAYGMPIDELKWGLDKLVWPMVAIDCHLLPSIKRCCHALALDEQRQTFTPTLFDETFEAQQVQEGKVASGRLTQVWFAGVHSNVGGGYPEDKLSLVTLDWMTSQALAAGLRFSPGFIADLAVDRSGFARLYDSRAGVAAYYRYGPRTIDMGTYPDGSPIRAIIHSSVVMRLARGSDAYAPISLPHEFDVLAPDGQLIPMTGFPYDDKRIAMREDRPLASVASKEVVDERVATLKDAIQELQRSPADAEMVGQVRDTVWWRRITYFATLAATLALIAFPFASGFYAGVVTHVVSLLGADLGEALNSGITTFDQYARTRATEATSTASHLLPSYVGYWLKALDQKPLEMIAAVVLVAIPFFAGNFLGARIHDRAWFAWHPARRADYLAWIRESFGRSTITALAITIVLGAATWFASVHALSGSIAAPIRLAFFIALVTLLWRVVLLAKVRLAERNDGGTAAKLPMTPTLWVARRLRTAGWLCAIYRLFAEKLVPIAFGLLVLAVIGCGALHVLYFGEQTAGNYCAASPSSSSPSAIGEPLTKEGFTTSDPCWASGIQVTAGRRYRAELQIGANDTSWFDRLERTDPEGFHGLDPRHLSAMLLKRKWLANWFAPVLRVGRFGIDEFEMKAECPRGDTCAAPVYEKIADDGSVPTFSPLPEKVAKALVEAHPHPEAPHAAMVEFEAQHDGELFVYVNDAILPWPIAGNLFYTNNSGSANLKVTDITDRPSKALPE